MRTRRLTALLLCAAMLTLCACKKAEPPEILETSAYPHVEASETRLAPPAYSLYADWTIRLTTASGQHIELCDSALVGLTVEAWSAQRLSTADDAAVLKNKLEFIDAQGSTRYSFACASDGKLLLKDKMNRMFRMPEYVYYTLEGQLLPYGLSLKSVPITWTATGDNAALQLEYYLPHVLKALKVPSLGYAMAYFTNTKIYQTKTLGDGTVKVYFLLTFVGYDLVGSSFSAVIRDIRPACLVLTPQKGDVWTVTSYSQAADPKNYESIRTILPYDFAKAALADVKNPSAILSDIRTQAADYLRETGLTMVTVEE
ncbi:MAG: hypothetical protein PHD32_10125 [Eubacteriales bacterium]|nr:hypothetical protein [Eubacteriales bacterium]